MIKQFSRYALFCACLAATACEGVKDQVGLTRTSPDEFAVVKRAPLEMPPSYSLRPPAPGMARPQEQSTSDQAKQTVFGAEAVSSSGPARTDGESLLLHHAGAEVADPNVRIAIDREAEAMKDYNKPVAQKLFGIGGDKNEVSATVVNAEEEAERLRKNQEEGKPVTEGETPSIED
jgi:hypothetical protein